MVMKPEPLAGAIRAAEKRFPAAKKVLLSPQGRLFNQQMAEALACEKGLVLICGRYEGIDERICRDFVDYEVSLGDFILTGGELGALMIIDAVTRLLRESWAGKIQPRMIPLRKVFWSMPIIPGRMNLKVNRFRRCCFPVTTRKLSNGDMNAR